jgi:Ni/Fe-hydrogenase subunit HybB-like protein
MTLTALGSGPLGIGIAVWVFNRSRLHVVMRPALVSGFLFYATGLVALGFDVGRPWNFWSFLLPWRWNAESAMLEISICMPIYCAVFLSFELLPLILERFLTTGDERVRKILLTARPYLHRLYPFMITGAFIVPLMHQSSLGGLLLLAGSKIHPLWQTPFLPLLYLLAAGVCGVSFVIFLLLIACLRYSLPLDLNVLDELGNVLSWVCLLYIAVRFADIVWRGQIHSVFAFDRMSTLFLIETALILVPAIALRLVSVRETPRSLLQLSVLACLGGMVFRFVPTTVAFVGAVNADYFPSAAELVMCLGYIAVGLLAFILAIQYFAVLPGNSVTPRLTFRPIYLRRTAPALEGESE